MAGAGMLPTAIEISGFRSFGRKLAVKGVAWVTDGREIENEIQKNIFEAACAELNRTSGADLDDKYSDRLVRSDDPTKQIDKIRLARAAVALTESVPDSAIEPIRKIVAFIKSATLKSV